MGNSTITKECEYDNNNEASSSSGGVIKKKKKRDYNGKYIYGQSGMGASSISRPISIVEVHTLRISMIAEANII